MVHIKFKYRDDYSNGKWCVQECSVRSLDECIRIYGLGVDCDYEILEIKEI